MSWEELRKQARQLEIEVDLKLVGLNKLGSQVNRSELRYDGSGSSTSVSNILLESLFAEVEDLLQKLTDVNNKMTSLVSLGDAKLNVTNPAVLHTLQRHSEILRDYSQEYQKTKSNAQARRDRERLLESVNRDVEVQKLGGVNNRSSKNDFYLKENDHVKHSDRLVDQQINVAIAVKENLHSQQFGLRDITRKLNTLSKKYPALHSLMQKIHMKKRRDTLVIGLVIAVCLFLLFLYASR